MEIKSVHRHIRQKGIGRPAQISIAFRFIYILHREQIGFLPAHQKQVVRGFAAFQLADIQRKAVRVQRRAVFTDEVEKTGGLALSALSMAFSC